MYPQLILTKNPHLVTDIKISNKVLYLSTNVGPKTNQIQEMVPKYGKVWYVDMDIANIFSLTNLFKKYRVAYDSHQYYAFDIHTNIGIIKYRRNKQGLYVLKPTYITKNSNVFITV